MASFRSVEPGTLGVPGFDGRRIVRRDVVYDEPSMAPPAA